MRHYLSEASMGTSYGNLSVIKNDILCRNRSYSRFPLCSGWGSPNISGDGSKGITFFLHLISSQRLEVNRNLKGCRKSVQAYLGVKYFATHCTIPKEKIFG